MKREFHQETETEKKRIFNELRDMVLSRHLQPEDKYEVAAIIESNGWNDEMAAEVFGVEDIFTLAADIWDSIRQNIHSQPIIPEKKLTLIEYLVIVIKSFFRGMIFAVPMAISVISMLTLQFSLWSYEYLSTELATAIAIGTIVSFVCVGGFTQIIARRGFTYLTQGYYYLLRRVTERFIKLGYVCSLVTALLFIIVNIFFGILPLRMMWIITLYFLFLNSIWLSVTVMFIFKQELAFTAFITLGIFLVFIFFKVLEINIIISQIISLFIISLLSLIYTYLRFKYKEKKSGDTASPLPRFSIVIYTVMPFFAYGFLYFAFLFTDRVVAWSTNNMYMPYFIWFRGPYELGLDFALLVLILPMGMVEVVVNEFIANLEANQKNILANETNIIKQKYLSLYIKRIVMILCCAVISDVLIYSLVNYVFGQQLWFKHADFLQNKAIIFVFLWAMIAYSILTVALMNAIILFSFSQPGVVSKSIFIALIVNFIIGFLLSRWVDYTWAVIGLFAGSLVFAILTCYQVIKLFNNLDYYLYAQS